METIYVVPKMVIKSSIVTYIQDAKEYHLHKMDYMKYAKCGIQEQCNMLGIKNYDTSLPQGWYDRFSKVTGMNPYGSIVWSYNEERHGGPVAITTEAKVALDIFNRIEAQA